MAAQLTPRELLEQQHEHLAKLSGQASRAARRAVVRVLVQLRREIDAIPGADFGGWTTATRHAMEVQLEAALVQMKVGAGAAMSQVHVRAIKRSYSDARKWLAAIDKRYLGAAQPLRFDLVAYAAREEQFLINRYARSLSFWGKKTSDAMRAALGDQMLIGKDWHDAARHLKKHLPALAGKKQWMIDRVAATEMANAYNGTAWEALMSEDRSHDRMMKQLVATFDKRTAKDSKQLHGQTVLVDKPFINVDGREYMYPPNRPRDREVIVGVRQRWGDHQDLLDEIDELDVG